MMARLVSAARLTPRSFGNSAVRFDGVDDRITVSGITPSTTNFSFAIWVNWLGGQVYSSAKNLISWDDSNGGFSLQHSSPSSSKVQFIIKNGAATDAQMISAYLSKGWHHIAGTYQQNNANLYVDGALAVQDTTVTMTAATQTFTIGRASGGTQPWIGTVDQFVFKNGTPWTAAEVLDLYQRGTIPANPTCSLFFNDGSGTTATDSSGNGNNGTLVGGTAWATDVPMKTRSTGTRSAAGTRLVAS